MLSLDFLVLKRLVLSVFLIFAFFQCFLLILNSKQQPAKFFKKISKLSDLENTKTSITVVPLTQIQVKLLYDIESIKKSPLIFIGGYARSGTTLMRAILDVHDKYISCGPEKKILPEILRFHIEFKNNPQNVIDVEEAGLNENKLDNAMRMYIYSIMNEHIKPSLLLCAKEPNVLLYMRYLHKLFPNSKFIYMVRDARAAVFSLIKQYKETLNQTSAIKHLLSWNSYNQMVKFECDQLGAGVCLLVKYESLVQNVNKTLRQIVHFLNVPWTDDLLKHEQFVGGRIAVSKIEWSTQQIKRPIYRDSLISWADYINYDLIDLYSRASMLLNLGYKVEIKNYDYLKNL